MVGYPYTKYTVSIMDVDLAGALIVASHEAADRLGVPRSDGSTCAGGPTAVTPCTWPSTPTPGGHRPWPRCTPPRWPPPGSAIDDLAHLDLYSASPSSVNLALDALGLEPAEPGGDRHRRAAVCRRRGQRLPDPRDRHDGRHPAGRPRSAGLVTGVGMHLTKHVAGVYTTAPGHGAPPTRRSAGRLTAPTRPSRSPTRHRARPPWRPTRWSTAETARPRPAWPCATCPTATAPTPGVDDAGLLAEMEAAEWVGPRWSWPPRADATPSGRERLWPPIRGPRGRRIRGRKGDAGSGAVLLALVRWPGLLADDADDAEHAADQAPPTAAPTSPLAQIRATEGRGDRLTLPTRRGPAVRLRGTRSPGRARRRRARGPRRSVPGPGGERSRSPEPASTGTTAPPPCSASGSATARGAC